MVLSTCSLRYASFLRQFTVWKESLSNGAFQKSSLSTKREKICANFILLYVFCVWCYNLMMNREKQYFKLKGMSPCWMKHLIIASLFYNITIVMMKGLNKTILNWIDTFNAQKYNHRCMCGCKSVLRNAKVNKKEWNLLVDSQVV